MRAPGGSRQLAAFHTAWQQGSQASLEDIIATVDEATDAANVSYPSRELDRPILPFSGRLGCGRRLWWLGHLAPEITCRVYWFVLANDDEVGRADMAETMSALTAGLPAVGGPRALGHGG